MAILGWVSLLLDPRFAHPADRTGPPARQPSLSNAIELPDGQVPPIDAVGNYIIGPTHRRSPEMVSTPNMPKGSIREFTMLSTESKIYTGIIREPNTFGTPDKENPAKLIVTTSHPAPYSRRVTVYVPAGDISNTELPFIVGADGPDKVLFSALDHLIATKKVPAMVAISISNGGGDAQGSQRGLEYDTMSGLYAEFVETEVLPRVEKECRVKLTKDPDGRATMGCSSGGSCAFIMAWYRPDLYHRVLTYSGTYVNQQWPWNADTPKGAWGFHDSIIAESPRKPLRIWLEISDRDLLNPNSMRDDMHDWVVANERMAKVLAEKGYPYQFVFARNAFHCDPSVKLQTLPAALQWLWQGYHPK
ncbi:esterase family protein [bacterium]|nr:esterase family protein [bacterium]